MRGSNVETFGVAAVAAWLTALDSWLFGQHGIWMAWWFTAVAGGALLYHAGKRIVWRIRTGEWK